MNAELEWNRYLWQRPNSYVLCEFRQPITGHTWLAYSRDFPPEFNIANLEWRLTGIGRAELEGY